MMVETCSDNTIVAERKTTASMSYRPDVDGLRAIAVIPVILYHYSLPPFTGGYVGVDVFFVISGYLITTLIHKQMLDGSFSILEFYERRVRRIFPALFFLLAIVTAVSFVLLFPSDLLGRGLRTAAATNVDLRSGEDALSSGRLRAPTSGLLKSIKSVADPFGIVVLVSAAIVALYAAFWLSVNHPTCVQPSTLPWLTCDDR